MRNNYAGQKKEKKSLIKAILKTFKKEYSRSFMIGMSGCLLDMLSPYLIQRII